MARFQKLWKKSPSTVSIRKEQEDGVTSEEMSHLWSRCKKCGATIYREEVRENRYICPKCGFYFRLSAFQRLRIVIDQGSFEEWKLSEEKEENPLEFPGYSEKLEEARKNTGLNEAVLCGKVRIHGNPAAVAVCDSRFLMGSMGTMVGEKITSLVERSTKEKLPVLMFCCSGGARMQEGVLSLMQMAKTAAALKRHSEAGLLSVSILTDPTTGGVTASFAMLGDIILAEPGALIGFAGPRVIEQTIHQKLPEGFQRSEFLLEHGFLDGIVERKDLRVVLAEILRFHRSSQRFHGNKQWDSWKVSRNSSIQQKNVKSDQEGLEKDRKREQISSSEIQHEKKDEESAWDIVLRSRRQDRLTAMDYIARIFDSFLELHGDRCGKDDGAIVGGIAWLNGRAVTVIAQKKGKNLKENQACNFGMPSPEGYRKALRLMKQAEKFHRPIICLVDTPGAFCGLEAEENGQGYAIANNLYQMSDLSVPIVSLIIGEGGSGGALAMAVSNEVWIMENAVYSVLSPEGFASILWKDSHKAKEAAEVMGMTAGDLLRLGIVDKIVPESTPACQKNADEICRTLKKEFTNFIERYDSMTEEEWKQQRYQRFRQW
ncbi:MAG: acetyl-CoA carboxylase carboxyltransferase subunit alpha [Clostridiales bacterium]|nr:acetyl-CoA carboxylase carboxyltransferase subunit alpha [Clostridiales bacterium]